ncbi:MAG TPA: hypothetical protein VFU89_08735 [Rhabdochlamydiaceae bacterium]|nr:hypothetical protein [Rhabdochlamydiaceae bacterium]
MYHAKNELFSEPLIDYLRNHGWKLMESEPDIAVLRKLFVDQEEEIILPRDRTYADYHQRILEAVQLLAKRENSTEKKIIEEMLLQKWDVLRIRIRGDRIGNGCISYLDKGIIEEGVRKVLLASARSILDPRVYFKRLYAAAAEQWMRKCYAGASEPGSYILTVQLPLEDDAENTERPFSRKVTEYLMESLSQLVELSENSDLLAEQTGFLLNANLCLGLAEMKPDETPINFDFEMKWSSEIPINKSIPARIEIHDRHFPSIVRIGQKLKPSTEVNQDLFVGKVLTLHGEANEQGNMQGEATLILLVDEQQTKAKAFFGPEFYSQACDAHKQNLYVRISGVLSEKPRCSDLKDISLFEVI